MSRSVILLAVASVAALGAGLLREVVVAHVYGTTAAADALAVMLYYIDSFAGVILTGVGTFMLVPALAAHQAAGRVDAGYGLVDTTLAWVGLLLLPVGAWALLGPATLAATVAPEFSPAQHAYLVSMLPMTGLTLVCLALSGVLSGSLQAAARYNLPALSRGLLGVGIAAGLIVGGGRWGVAAGAVGLLAGAVAQLSLLAVAQWRLGWRPAWPRLRHAGLANAAAVGVPVLLTLVLTQLVVGGVQRALASSLPEGSLAAVNYAHRVMNMLATVSVAFGTVSLTELAVQFRREGAGTGTRRMLENSLQGVFFAFVPMSALMILLAEPLVALLFQRGQYDEASLRLTVACLRWYALAGVSGALAAVLVRAAYPAFGRLWRVVLIGTVSGITTIVVTAVLLRAGAGAVSLPIGFGLGLTVNCVVSIAGLWDIVGARLAWRLVRYGLRVGLLAALAAAAPLLVNPMVVRLSVELSPWLAALIRFSIGAALFCGVYGALALATREPQASLLFRGAARRLGAWRAALADG